MVRPTRTVNVLVPLKKLCSLKVYGKNKGRLRQGGHLTLEGKAVLVQLYTMLKDHPDCTSLISECMGIVPKTVRRWVNRHRTGRGLEEIKSGGRPRTVRTPAMLKTLQMHLKRVPQQERGAWRQVQAGLKEKGYEVPLRTLRDAAAELGIKSRVVPSRPRLTREHITMLENIKFTELCWANRTTRRSTRA